MHCQETLPEKSSEKIYVHLTGKVEKGTFLKIRLNFQLDKRLESDTLWVGDMPLCKVLLMNVGNFPGLYWYLKFQIK